MRKRQPEPSVSQRVSKEERLWVALQAEHKRLKQRCLLQRNRMGEAGTFYLCWPEGFMAKTAVPLPSSCPVKKKTKEFVYSLFLLPCFQLESVTSRRSLSQPPRSQRKRGQHSQAQECRGMCFCSSPAVLTGDTVSDGARARSWQSN